MVQKTKRAVKSPFDTALGYISLKQRTGAEVENYLRSRDVPQEAVDSTMDKLRDYNYVDDMSYAENFVSLNQNKLSRYAIEQKLRQRGVDSFIIEDALVAYEGEDETALSLAKEVVRKNQGFEQRKLRQKLIRQLMNKGFSYDCASSCANQVIQDDSED